MGINGSAKLYFRDAGIFIYSDADGSLTIESDGAGTPVNINLKSTDGRESFVVRDNDGFPVVKLDTAGNVQTKGIFKRKPWGKTPLKDIVGCRRCV